jgi:hypothetical protein
MHDWSWARHIGNGYRSQRGKWAANSSSRAITLLGGARAGRFAARCASRNLLFGCSGSDYVKSAHTCLQSPSAFRVRCGKSVRLCQDETRVNTEQSPCLSTTVDPRAASAQSDQGRSAWNAHKRQQLLVLGAELAMPTGSPDL